MKEEELKIAQEEQQDEHCSKGEGNHHNKHKKKEDETQEDVHSENKDVQNILGSSTSIKVIEVQVFFSYE